MSRGNLKKIKRNRLASNGSQSIVLKIVRDSAPISRSRIAEHSGRPLPAISRTVSRLLKDRILIETPLSDETGPRRKRGLSINPSAGHCLSVHYGAFGLDGAILNAAYDVVKRKTHRQALDTISREEKIKAIVTFVKELRSEAPQSAGKCLALAVVDPGVIDEETGTVLISSTMEDWTNVPIVEILEERFNLPVMLTSSSLATVRAADRLELKGAASNLIYIEYDEGIGCGLKLQGNYITGQSNLAGEFGHMRVTENRIQCRCGSVGCLEAVAALPALARNATKAIEKGGKSSLAERENIDGTDVLAAAAEGDSLALRVVNEAFDYVGRAVGGLVNTLAPQAVVFNSIVAAGGDEAVATLMDSVRTSVLPSHMKNLDLRISELNSHIACLGGAAAALDNCLEN